MTRYERLADKEAKGGHLDLVAPTRLHRIAVLEAVSVCVGKPGNDLAVLALRIAIDDNPAWPPGDS